jgi:ABC-type branched-subunit amino acid transport system ATPase component
MGLTTYHAGAIEYRGAPVAALPTHARNRLGIG